ncbi:hypothetical protein GCM10022226_39970 [Sphaerisporangium flaviroseum]|uniref:Exonuclease domain-containing protein n=2 Tax=Sphaerisporangium flaviroseum TaxID=509199 RepID=A0ABP7ICP4_9ACTN
MAAGYHSLVNPRRRIPRRPWISPGLTDDTLAAAPSLDVIEPELAIRLDGAYIVGHNVGVDWRLLSLRCPGIRPTALIDTLKLARLARTGNPGRSLTVLLDHYGLTEEVTRLTSGGQPHRALWDATGAALLLAALIADLPRTTDLTVAGLRQAADVLLDESQSDGAEQFLLF